MYIIIDSVCRRKERKDFCYTLRVLKLCNKVLELNGAKNQRFRTLILRHSRKGFDQL